MALAQNMIAYSFVVPAFNEEHNVPLLYEKIQNLMIEIDSNWELIFINDGSKDNTLQVIKYLAAKDSRVKFLNLSRNFGHQVALTSGLNYAQGNAIISLDCDLQDPPEVISQMIDKWKDGFDIVYARRRNRHDGFLKKYTALWYYKLLDRFSEVSIPRNVGDFRLIDKKVHVELLKMKEKSIYLRGMVSWLGFSHTFVDFDRPERIHGATGYSWPKMIKLAMDGILNFSLLPLKIGFVIGNLSIITGFLFLLYMVYDTFANDSIYPLIKWLIVLLFIFIGFIFILIWLLGEYIGRIYEETKNRPVFVISEKGNLDENINV